MRTLDIDTTEALFKLALEKKDYPEVMRMVRVTPCEINISDSAERFQSSSIDPSPLSSLLPFILHHLHFFFFFYLR